MMHKKLFYSSDICSEPKLYKHKGTIVKDNIGYINIVTGATFDHIVGPLHLINSSEKIYVVRTRHESFLGPGRHDLLEFVKNIIVKFT